jgi:hypothetical protein
MSKEYITKAKTVRIEATSRVALKIKDNFYTIEAKEERSVDDTDGIDIEKEWTALFDDLNNIVDSQCEEIKQMLTSNR